MKQIKFGVIGCGLMGREFASAAARWCHLLDLDFQPVIVAACDLNSELAGWFERNIPTVKQTTKEYRELLENKEIDAIYCAVPHNLHEQLYIDVIKSGKHLLGEKPFGIDQAANRKIVKALPANSSQLIRCSSEFPFYPGVQRVTEMVQSDDMGTILEVEAGFWHSSDLDPKKAINWKRMIALNGEYGCMGDLGMHVVHLPLRLGWKPRNVRAHLLNIVKERPDSSGKMVPCETWDNAILSTTVSSGGQEFPMTLSTKRIAPGHQNTWYIRVWGTKKCVEYSTKYPKTLNVLEYSGGEQAWKSIDTLYKSAYPTITGAIFEFGFSDGMLQMWAAFCDEVVNGKGKMRQPFHCATPEEAAISHELFTAALQSQREQSVVELRE